MAIAGDTEPPYLVLRAQIHKALGSMNECEHDLRAAISEFEEPGSLDDWALGWLITAARMSADKALEDEALAEQKRRKQGGAPDFVGGILPEHTRSVQRRE